MRRTAYVRQAALVATLAALALPPVPKTALQTGAYGDAYAGFTDVIIHETMYCNACGEEQQFSVVYTKEYGQSEPVFGVHGRMTMCMNCGAINSDLPAGDSAFGAMVFRVESCALIHTQRELSCEAAGDENHLRTVVDTLQCAQCGDVLSERGVITEPHGFSAWITDKEATSEQEGLRHRVCEACGAVQSEAIERLRPTPEPELTPTRIPEPAAEPTPGVTGVQTDDEPEAEPTRTPAPTLRPAPETTPKATPTPEATPRPTLRPTQNPAPGATPKPASGSTRKTTPSPSPEVTPTDEPTPEPARRRIPMTGAGFGQAATAEPSPDAKAGERESGVCCCCCCRAPQRRYRWRNVIAREEA